MLQVFQGTYTQYKEDQLHAAEKVNKVSLAQELVQRKQRPVAPSAEEKRRRIRLRAVEEEIAFLESELSVLARQLENPPSEVGKVHRLGTEYARRQSELDELMAEWEKLHEQAEPVGSEI